MTNPAIISNKQKLDNLFEQIKDLRAINNLLVESQWSIYLCIRVSGFLEISIRSVYSSYCANKAAHPNVLRYIGSSFDGNRSQNMNPDKILYLAGSFNQTWRHDLESYLYENGRKDAIESVINIRNSAAHGGTMSISYATIKNYYQKVWEVIQFIDTQCQE